MGPILASRPTCTPSLLYLLLIVLQFFSPPVYGYWDNFAFGGGKWFSRVRETGEAIQRDVATDTYECRTSNTRNIRDPALDGAIVWNRPDEPMILGLAFYADNMCGNSAYAVNKGRPLAVMIIDKKRLRGLHIANFNKLDEKIPPALISTKRTASVQAFRVSDEVGVGGFLRGIPARELPNSIIWWDTREKRHVLRNGVSWANAELYESLTEVTTISKFLREVVERVANATPDTPRGNSEALMVMINRLVGLGQSNMELMLPPPDPDSDLTLDGQTDDHYGRHIYEFSTSGPGSTWGPVLTSGLTDSLVLTRLAPAVLPGRALVEDINNQAQIVPEPQPQPIAPDNLSVQNNPSSGSSNSLFDDDQDGIPEDLKRALQQIEQQVESHDPTTIIARLDIPIAQLTAAFNAAPDKEAWLNNMENRERMNMRVLLLVKGWLGEYEEEIQGLDPGTLTRENNWMGLNIDTSKLYPELRRAFDSAPDKVLWYALMESRQKWNMRALRVARDLYRDWLEAENESMRGRQGSVGSARSKADEGLLLEGLEDDNNIPALQNEVIQILDQNDDGVLLQQGQQDAVPDDGVIEVEDINDALTEVDAPGDYAYTDSFFVAGNSPTFVISDNINWDLPESSNTELRSQAPEPEAEVRRQNSNVNVPAAVANEQQDQPQAINQPQAVDQPQDTNRLQEANQPQEASQSEGVTQPNTNPQRVLRLQTEGLNPNDPYLIDDFYKYFDPNSAAFKDILYFNPRLIQEMQKNPGKVLGIPDLGIKHYEPPVPDLDLDDSELFDTPSGTISEGVRTPSLEEIEDEEIIEQVGGEPVGGIVEEVIRNEVLEQEVIREGRGGQEIEEEIVETKQNIEVEPDEVPMEEEEEDQTIEPLLGGRPASEVIEELQEQLQEEEEEEPRRSTRYGGNRPPPGSMAPAQFEPTFTPRWTPNHTRRRQRKALRMANMIEDEPVEEPRTNHVEEPPPRRVDYWDRPVEDRRDRNMLIKTRGSRRGQN
ncbi:hypothetical protein TWF718_000756 [Orbilia javanica]|uniref:Uncharacterized protein n=1 Tax=Orbilia javanica TaxID=47235 RepID=A0AAN8N4P7_9PEZI